MPRLFTAIRLPPDIALQLARFKTPLPGARWVTPTDYHITLRFLGDVENPIAREFADNLSRIELDGFEIALCGFGVFGGHDPKVLWAGIEAPPQLDALYRAHENAARAAGMRPERRKFKPHVTIARFRHARVEAVSRFLQRHAASMISTIYIDRFQLMSSKPRTGGGPYATEEEFDLRNYSWPEDIWREDFDELS